MFKLKKNGGYSTVEFLEINSNHPVEKIIFGTVNLIG